MPGLIPYLVGKHLIQGNGVLIIHVSRAGGGSSQEHVGIVVPMNIASGWMG